MARYQYGDPLPAPMQGNWVDPSDGATLSVEGSDVQFQGAPIAYDHFEISEDNDALTVSFGVDDLERLDSFARENLTGLVIDPDGNFHGYNTKFACTFIKIGALSNDHP